jgi:hypothetical protein
MNGLSEIIGAGSAVRSDGLVAGGAFSVIIARSFAK